MSTLTLACHRCDERNTFVEYLRAPDDAYELATLEEGCPQGSEVAICRNCGLKRFFDCFELPSLDEIRQAIWSESGENVEAIARLKFSACLYPPDEDRLSEPRRLAKYHNILVKLRTTPDVSLLPLPDERLIYTPASEELPASSKDALPASHDSWSQDALAVSEHGRRQNEHSSGYDSKRRQTGQKSLVFSAPQRAHNAST